ncbi:hypothetical protein [Candidatus Ichthyocystis hellenicum]|uniref:hypothetical protein n=1 Tax=Candidatus Ichthyocystis hellenicum TaxID=1561003 RepID=UPI000B896B97|nr:hypothetical protein [Candidatus Ichthyocystis hellenicum]
MVVVVSPNTLPAPPALAAATMAAMNGMQTSPIIPLAIVPPISAAIMLSKNIDKTKIINKRVKYPLGRLGMICFITFVKRERSKCSEMKENVVKIKNKSRRKVL